MSKAQGDGYRTQTNEALNAYRDRLDAKLEKLYDTKEKWYHVGSLLDTDRAVEHT